MIDGGISRQRPVDEFVRLVDAVGNLCDDDAVPVKACHRDLFVCGDDDAVGGGDLRICKDILHARRAVGFDLDGNAALFCVLLKAFCCHKGVGDARRTCRDGEKADVIGRGCRGFFCGIGCCKTVMLLVVDELAERIDRFRLNERFLKVRIHNHGGEL